MVDDVVGYISRSGREIAARSETPSSIALGQLGELHLNAARWATLDALHDI